jgi:hypothetical protein
MKILICVKQVPEITDVTINPERGTLMREGVSSILNPFCEYAMEVALGLKRQRRDIELVAISMGPPQASSALMRCLEMGADRAILLSDVKFAGSDTWATALTLAEVIKRIEGDFNLILVGKQAIDGDTAQVGPEMAEILGRFSSDAFTSVVSALISKEKPSVFLFGATPHGRELAPRVAARLELGLTADCTGLDIDDKGNLIQTRPAFGGNIMASIISPYTRPQMATVRPNVFSPGEPDSSRKGRIEDFKVALSHTTIRTKLVSVEQLADEGERGSPEKLNAKEQGDVFFCYAPGPDLACYNYV